jgi:hypothetical protein
MTDFFAEYRAGRVQSEDIMRYIREWAGSAPGSPAAQVDLWDYLGLTKEQYQRWVGKGELPEV